MGRYRVEVSETARKHLSFFHKSGDKVIIKRIERIFEELGEDPYHGVGKPEALKHDLAGLWSRRLDRKNRLVYQVVEQTITVIVVAARGHYDDK
jgi:toxin YoeB